ncbi:MAG TPA: exo-alpha-sialidase [Ohtaekwangia sp.]|nr:exo-alpha-sialidase [Ohtaekwangia sp.]
MNNTLVGFLITLVLLSCTAKTEKINISDLDIPGTFLGDSTKRSGCTYFTTDHNGSPVLSFTAGTPDSTYLFYATYDTVRKSFNLPVRIAASLGTDYHEESMNKVAFKNDGTIVAAWEIKHPTPKNKYAGSLRYTQSYDDGKTWAKPAYLHTDTSAENSRGFFDLVTLPDGEVGAVWLDGRHQLGEAGSSLFFAKTKENLGFQSDYQIAETVCQCCRTDLYTDTNNVVHITFRDIDVSAKGQVRDITYLQSSNSGDTFTTGKKISNDNWIIDGCPHTGASMASVGNNLMTTWFTSGGTPGIYTTVSTGGGQQFQSRKLLSEQGRHPQMTAKDSIIYVVWDEYNPVTTHHHAGHEHNEISQGKNSITLMVLNVLDGSTTHYTLDQDGGSFPVVHVKDNIVLVAYTLNHQLVIKGVDVVL